MKDKTRVDQKMDAHYTELMSVCPEAIMAKTINYADMWLKCMFFILDTIMAEQNSDNALNSKAIFKVIFYNESELFEVYARQIFNSDLYGFIEIEEMLFGEKTQIVVDPSEEKLKAEFSGVKRSYIPQQNIVRIDEVEKLGAVKVTESKASNVTNFPVGKSLK